MSLNNKITASVFLNGKIVAKYMKTATQELMIVDNKERKELSVSAIPTTHICCP
ncbi:MAG: hypothetical protein ACPKPY_03760 [Nitrososphaeraceae archaeon]